MTVKAPHSSAQSKTARDEASDGVITWLPLMEKNPELEPQLPPVTVYVSSLGGHGENQILSRSRIGSPITEVVWPEFIDEAAATSATAKRDLERVEKAEPQEDFRSDPRKCIADFAQNAAEALLLEQVVGLADHARLYIERAGGAVDMAARRGLIGFAQGLLETQLKVYTAIAHAHNQGRQEVIVHRPKEDVGASRSRRKRSDPREATPVAISKVGAHAS